MTDSITTCDIGLDLWWAIEQCPIISRVLQGLHCLYCAHAGYTTDRH